MNKIFISGNLCKELEVSYTKTSNLKVGKFTIAIRRDKDNADFIQCIAYGKTCEFMEKYCHEKGQKATVIGRIQTRHYTDKDSKEVYVTEVIVDEIEPVFSKKESITNQEAVNNTSTTSQQVTDDR